MVCRKSQNIILFWVDATKSSVQDPAFKDEDDSDNDDNDYNDYNNDAKQL